MPFIAHFAIFSGFVAFCLSISLAVVAVETEADVLAELRGALGAGGPVERHALALAVTPDVAERVSNWRAYSGANRHLPLPGGGWTREELSDLRAGVVDFRAAHRPSTMKPRAAENLGLLAGDPWLDAEGRGEVDLASAGVIGGAAQFRKGKRAFVATLQRIPSEYAGVMKPATAYMTFAEKVEQGILETAINGRIFRYKAKGFGDSTYVAMTGRIGKIYLLSVEGNAPMHDIVAHLERMDFRRLEEEGETEADPMASLSRFSDVLLGSAGAPPNVR